jgi:hypothetical protein
MQVSSQRISKVDKTTSIITISSKKETTGYDPTSTKIVHCYEHDGSEESFERETLKAYRDIQNNLQEMLAQVSPTVHRIREAYTTQC